MRTKNQSTVVKVINDDEFQISLSLDQLVQLHETMESIEDLGGRRVKEIRSTIHNALASELKTGTSDELKEWHQGNLLSAMDFSSDAALHIVESLDFARVLKKETGMALNSI